MSIESQQQRATPDQLLHYYRHYYGTCYAHLRERVPNEIGSHRTYFPHRAQTFTHLIIGYLYGNEGLAYTDERSVQNGKSLLGYYKVRHEKDLEERTVQKAMKRDGLSLTALKIAFVITCIKDLVPDLNQAVPDTGLPATIMKFVGVSYADSIGYVSSHLTKKMEKIFPPIHELFETMVRCEQQREQKTEWPANKHNDLKKRLTSLHAGQQKLAAYFKRKIWQVIHYEGIWGLHFITSTYSYTHTLPKKSLAPFLAEMGPGIKDIFQKELKDRDLIPLNDFLDLFEKAYSISIEELLRLVFQEITLHILPHLTDVLQLEKEVGILFDRLSLFLVRGMDGFQAKRENLTGKERLILFKLLQITEEHVNQVSSYIPAIAALIAPHLTASIENNFEVIALELEKSLPTVLKELERYFSKETIKQEIIPGIIRPLWEIMHHYRDGLLYTFLAGFKKERAGKFAVFNHPSHFHTEFHQLFLKEMFQIGFQLLTDGMREAKKGAFHRLDFIDHAVKVATTHFHNMSQTFKGVK